MTDQRLTKDMQHRPAKVLAADDDENNRAVLDVPEAEEGQRMGRFVTLCDLEGRRYAVAPGSVAVMSETDEGTLLMLPGGRMLHVGQALSVVAMWLSIGAQSNAPPAIASIIVP